MSETEIRALYAASYRRLLGQLIGVTGNVAEAEDVVQEAFVRGLDHPARLLGADNPEASLRTVAVNLARSRRRRAQRLVGLAPRLVEEPRDADTDGHVILLQALRRLPAGQREVIALHHLADLTVEQVADTLGLPTGTVKTRLSRGRAALSTLVVTEGPMSELTPLREAVDTLASRTSPPDFGELKTRATRRGRRRVAMVAAATAAVVAGSVLAVIGPGDDRRSAPPDELPTPSVDAEQIIADGHLYDYDAHASGTVLTVWTTCQDEIDTDCGHAWRLGAGARPLATGVSSHGVDHAYELVHAGNDGFLVSDPYSQDAVPLHVALDGTVTSLAGCRDDNPPVEPGRLVWDGIVLDTVGVYCPTRFGGGDFDDDGMKARFLTGSGGFTADGRLWALVDNDADPDLTLTIGMFDGTRWHYRDLAPKGSANNSTVAAAGSNVVVLGRSGLSVTTDGGATWHEVNDPQALERDLPFLATECCNANDPVSMAFAGRHTLYVADAFGGLWRSTDLTTFHVIEAPGALHNLKSADDDVLAMENDTDDLVRIAADGRVERLTVR